METKNFVSMENERKNTDVLYKTEITMTSKEVIKAVNSCFFKMGGILPVITILLVIIGITCWFLGSRGIAVEFFILAVFLPFIMYLASICKTRHAYRTHKTIQDVVIKYSFYDTYFNAVFPGGCIIVKYDDLYRIIETKDRFYLFINNISIYIINKNMCPEGLTELLQNVKGSLKRTKEKASTKHRHRTSVKG